MSCCFLFQYFRRFIGATEFCIYDNVDTERNSNIVGMAVYTFYTLEFFPQRRRHLREYFKCEVYLRSLDSVLRRAVSYALNGHIRLSERFKHVFGVMLAQVASARFVRISVIRKETPVRTVRFDFSRSVQI